MRTMRQMQAAAKWDTGFSKPESEPPVRVQPVVGPPDCRWMTYLIETGEIDGYEGTCKCYAWFLLVSDLPNDKMVCHECDNPACWNPAHLHIGTALDNYLEMKARGRLVRLRGEAHGQSKLTESDVAAIRATYSPRSGNTSLLLSKKYNVCFQTICDVINRKNWRHVS